MLELAEKWLNGTITPEEEKEYAGWYNNLDDNAGLKVSEEWATDREDHRRKLLKRINRQKARVASLPASLLYKITAAAVLIIIAGVAWRYFNRTPPPIPVAATTGTGVIDVQPGVNGAVLTMANGKTIVLDTAGNGRLMTDAAAHITKTDGSVAFTAASEHDATIHEYNTLVTPRGRQQQLVLSDGTRIWLNAESSIRFPTAFAPDIREVEITGEVYFEVSKNPAAPFMVNVNGMQVQVLGTHFNINAYPNEEAIATTLLEGRVKVVNRQSALPPDHPGGGNRQSAILRPGQQAILSQASRSTQPIAVHTVDVDQVVAWKNGIQAFESADIKMIMRQVERWYDIDVEFKGAMPARTFTGEIPRSANLSELLKLFEVAKIHFSMDTQKKKLTVMP
ncbi:hypothetical protein A3860_21745 [Niastella vici]|uniref:Iron dicitrate transport regulator FecR n=2 Tax=Niastella vici TaxID=1703345 RepID=A0A1V9G0D4_9BACT|nr:hypothetical protein A3860_21745 [Niastella vici]